VDVSEVPPLLSVRRRRNSLRPAAGLVVVDRRDTARRLGNVHHAITAGVLDPSAPLVELGELLDQHRIPRPAETLSVATLVGIGAQDLAAASVVADRWNAAQQAGLAQ
jgi:ornithine cyclodeaminase